MTKTEQWEVDYLKGEVKRIRSYQLTKEQERDRDLNQLEDRIKRIERHLGLSNPAD